MPASPALRALPPQPSLEFERKEAKALLRRLRAGDPEALARARARHPALDPGRVRLADAQLVTAREYGFASWPRLVRYFAAAERQQQSVRRSRTWLGGSGVLDSHVRDLLARQRAGDLLAGRALAAYVPRFYGLRPDAALAAAVTEDDARLAVARTFGAPSWDVALARAEQESRGRRDEPWEGASPRRRAAEALAAADLPALEQVVAAHPELLHPPEEDVTVGGTLIAFAVGQERRLGAAAMRPIMDWLAARGFDRQLELNALLASGRGRVTADEVRALVAQGADPAWVAPNGIPMLEHALLRYWNGEAVDALAALVTPRRALWIAAGLGDVEGVRRFLDARGRPTPAARRLRPDFAAAGRVALPSLPDADDEEILFEALLVAVLNGRTAVIEQMASRGTPVNSLIYGSPLVYIAVGNSMIASAEALVRCGADLDLRDDRGHSAREIARELFEQTPNDAARRRVAELCGLDLHAVLAERDARPASPPVRLPVFEGALALAADDAVRLGQAEVRPENLLVGLLRLGNGSLSYLVNAGRMDLGRFRQEMADRMRPIGDRIEGQALPMHPDAQAAVDAAVALATARRQDVVHGLHLLAALTRAGDRAVDELLARYGASDEALVAQLDKWL